MHVEFSVEVAKVVTGKENMMPKVHQLGCCSSTAMQQVFQLVIRRS